MDDLKPITDALLIANACRSPDVVAPVREPETLADELLRERQTTHGDFPALAALAQSIKDLLRSHWGWKHLDASMREALESDALKTARILCGSQDFYDHWADKAGYATLIANTLYHTKRMP